MDRDVVRILLDEATDITADHDGDVSTVVKDGSPSSEILDYVTDYNIDIVVMGFRKRSPTGKALFGSTAQDVLLSVDCPVVTVPNPES